MAHAPVKLFFGMMRRVVAHRSGSRNASHGVFLAVRMLGRESGCVSVDGGAALGIGGKEGNLDGI